MPANLISGTAKTVLYIFLSVWSGNNVFQYGGAQQVKALPVTTDESRAISSSSAPDGVIVLAVHDWLKP
ncbi:hypothetical protein EKX87_22355 [Salmonella enterica]|uniref:Uncharacterized protein n=1 Tax=Salmonella enterica TaxID=28901 RepID=A0A5T3RHW2_SALER|nr:hypothetical protein [Salmonella enterica]